MRLLLANPRGFCAGVERAIAIVERALALHSPPVYVRHEVVHNRFVVENLRKKGAVFVNEIDEVPAGAVVIFSAHGVSKTVRARAREIGAVIYDATCPLVTKVHKEVLRRGRKNQKIVLIGHSNHPEVEGTLGQIDERDNIFLVESEADVAKLPFDPDEALAYTTQTTLSVDDTRRIVARLRARFPKIEAPKKDDICYATQNRQNAVKELMGTAEVLLVIGSKNSSNSNRLKEITKSFAKPAYLIDDASQIKRGWLEKKTTIGLTAGASAPEVLVQEVVARLRKFGVLEVVEVAGVGEDVHFPVPVALRE